MPGASVTLLPERGGVADAHHHRSRRKISIRGHVLAGYVPRRFRLAWVRPGESESPARSSRRNRHRRWSAEGRPDCANASPEEHARRVVSRSRAQVLDDTGRPLPVRHASSSSLPRGEKRCDTDRQGRSSRPSRRRRVPGRSRIRQRVRAGHQGCCRERGSFYLQAPLRWHTGCPYRERLDPQAAARRLLRARAAPHSRHH